KGPTHRTWASRVQRLCNCTRVAAPVVPGQLLPPCESLPSADSFTVPSVVAVPTCSSPAISRGRAHRVCHPDAVISRAPGMARNDVTRPGVYRAALDSVAARSPSHTLADVSLAAVHAAQQDDPNVMEVLCSLAGLSYRDLRERTRVALPTNPTGTWRYEQLSQ